MRLPNFLVIGAQKCGTGWLHNFLGSRPDVFVPKERKELWFFDHEDRFLSLGVPGYAAYFEAAGAAVAVGEATPGYLFVDDPHPDGGHVNAFRRGVPERARDVLGPDLKLIASLRNPIDRSISAFLHHRKRKRIPAGRTIGGCWATGAIVNIGFYGAQLAKWADVFS